MIVASSREIPLCCFDYSLSNCSDAKTTNPQRDFSTVIMNSIISAEGYGNFDIILNIACLTSQRFESSVYVLIVG